MQFTETQFLNLMEAVHDAGGESLPERCDGRVLKYTQEDSKGRQKTYETKTQGCKRDSRFVVPYELGDLSTKDRNAMLKRGGGFIKACAHDDDMGQWPRFRKKVMDDDGR
jgi:hypothetical protein